MIFVYDFSGIEVVSLFGFHISKKNRVDNTYATITKLTLKLVVLVRVVLATEDDLRSVQLVECSMHAVS